MNSVQRHWPTTSLGPICEKIGSGVTPRGGDSVYTSDGIRLIRSQNIYNLQFAPDGIVHITDEQADKMRGVEVIDRDVLLNITGDSVARCCRAPESLLPARVNQHVAIIRPKADRLDSDFLTYFLTSPFMQQTMLSLAGSGGTRKALTKSMIEKFLVPLPPLPVQKNISRILKAYDDLIANNERRIALLERTARLLFVEWFVQLRYPGHEHNEVVDGLPEGWSRKPLIEFCSRITDGAHASPKTTDYGKPMASVKDMREWDFDVSKCRLISDADFQLLVNSDCKPLKNDILVAKDGANLNKHTFLVKDEREIVVLSSIAIIRTLETVNAEYMVSMLRSDEVSERIKRNVSGAAIPRIVLKDFKRLPVVMPTQDIQTLWQKTCGPINDMCRVITRWNQTLANARDLLLPRLVDGRISL